MTSSSLPLDRLREEFEKWLAAARTTGERALDVVGLGSESRGCSPASDMIETTREIHLYIDLPGSSADKIEVLLVGSILKVKAVKCPPTLSETQVVWHLRERICQTVEREWHLPAQVNPDHVRATYRDGVLHVILEKSPAEQPHVVPVHYAGFPDVAERETASRGHEAACG
ncbi:MAG: hypothetical protein KatS3mg113_0912 [Planctomycetaceae bacterium]|nr:MAG: hypothetical protein KatS3mg113_0912 [Planctomycetaceae bacterium]